MYIYTKNDYKVLTNIIDEDMNKGTNKLNGVTIKHICEKTNLSDKKVRIAIKHFLEDKMVQNGLSDGRSQTFYLTDTGIQEIININNSIIEEE